MELMPPIRRRRSAWRFIWERQFATVGLFILLLLGGWGIWQTHQRLIWINPSPTTLAATATMTEVPEVTMANTEPAHGGRTLFTAVATAPTQPLFVATPAPIPTPAVAPDAGY